MRRAGGFSLVELIITVSVLAVVTLLVVPGLGGWIANARMRTVAESLQNGLRLAQGEAVRRNRQTVFALTNATPSITAAPQTDGSNWYVRALPLLGTAEDLSDASFYVQGGTFTNQSVSIAGPALVCFNSLGRQVANSATGLTSNCGAPADAVYTVTRSGADRRLKVQVSIAGRVRMCDPDKNLANAPDGC